MSATAEEQSLRRTLRAIGALSGSALLLQFLSLASAPVLSRLYLPDHFGVLATVLSVAAPVTLLSTLQFPAAIVVAPDEDDADALLATAVRATLVAVAILVGAGLSAARLVASWLHLSPATAAMLVAAIGVSILVNSVSGVAASVTNRQQRYQVLALGRLAAAVAGLGVNLAIGFTRPGWWGLLAGYVASNVTMLGVCGWSTRDVFRRALRSAPGATASRAFSRFRRYPLYVLPSDVVNSMLQQAPVYALTAFSGVAATGSYGLGQRMLGLPMTLVGSSVGEVFTRQASIHFAKSGECRALFRRTAGLLALIALPIFAIIAVAGPDLFAIVFGPRWRAAGEYVRILAPMMALRFVASPLAAMYIVAGRQREDMLLHWGFGLLMVCALVFFGRLGASSHALVATCSLSMTLFYLVYLVRSWHFARGATTLPSTARPDT